MMDKVYRYTLDGFTLVSSPFAVPEEYDGWNEVLEDNGWTLVTRYGGDWSLRAAVYRRKGEPNRYVEVFDDCADAYTVFVTPDAWPTFLRLELTPLMRLGVETECRHNLERLAYALITIGRHGVNTPIDDIDGRSPLDKNRQ